LHFLRGPKKRKYQTRRGALGSGGGTTQIGRIGDGLGGISLISGNFHPLPMKHTEGGVTIQGLPPKGEGGRRKKLSLSLENGGVRGTSILKRTRVKAHRERVGESKSDWGRLEELKQRDRVTEGPLVTQSVSGGNPLYFPHKKVGMGLRRSDF